MARTASSPPASQSAEASPDGFVGIINYKGTPEFALWVDDLAHMSGLPVANMVDMALRDYGTKLQHRPMPRRQRPSRRMKRA
jgi:hypothetical protein